MNRRIGHTPDGVRDIYKDECEKKRILERKISNVISSYGYRFIETPTFEFFDVFSSNIGTTPSAELYKFFDRDGHTLVLRPDFTPSIARAASKYFMEDDSPIRLSYVGNTFINHSSYRGELKETTQIGAELISDGSVDADAEIAAMAVETMRSSGLKDFQISLGNVRYFEELAALAGLDECVTEELRELIRNKNSFGAEKLLAGLDVPEALSRCLCALPGMFGSGQILDRAGKLALEAGADGAAAAVYRLQKVEQILRMYGYDSYITFDLGMMSTYMYYTGIIFRGYTYGTGDAIVKGGRYDGLLANFGKDRPSTGFVVVIDQLMNALRRQKISVEPGQGRELVLYTDSAREEAVQYAVRRRREGAYVVLQHVDSAGQMDCRERQMQADAVKVIRMGGAL